MNSQTQTAVHAALNRTLQQELLVGEHLVWFSYPESARRAKQVSIRSLLSSWAVLRVVLLAAMLLVFFLTSLIYQTDSFLPLTYGGTFFTAVIVGAVIVLLRRKNARRRLEHTIYGITNQRLLLITLDRGQFVQNTYTRSDLGRIDLIERSDGWGDIVIGGQQSIQPTGFSLVVVSPRLSGVPKVREVAALLTRLKSEQRILARQ